MTWEEIVAATGGRTTGNNHDFVAVEGLSRKAKSRLAKFEQGNVSKLFWPTAREPLPLPSGLPRHDASGRPTPRAGTATEPPHPRTHWGARSAARANTGMVPPHQRDSRPSAPVRPLRRSRSESDARNGSRSVAHHPAPTVRQLLRLKRGQMLLDLRHHHRLVQSPGTATQQFSEGTGNLRWRYQRNNIVVAHVRCAPIAETMNRELEFSRDKPHNSTHPYTTFEHCSGRLLTIAVWMYIFGFQAATWSGHPRVGALALASLELMRA